MSLKVLLNDQIDKLFEDNPELNSVNKNKFEIAVASFANLNHLYGIDFDDLVDGIMGNGGDEGIDLCYIFCNGNLIQDEEYPINKENHVKIKFFQVKKENGFSTNGFKNLKEGIEQIFNLELNLQDLKTIGANQEYIDKADLIRKIFRKSSKESAKFSCEVFYATISDADDVSEKILKLQKDLNSKLNSLNISFDFENWGAQKLLDMTKMVDEELEIKFNSQPLEIKERNVDTSGYAGFISGEELIKSLLNDNDEFKSHLTEGNVRFFLGEDKNINSSIIETANDNDKIENFWAMNNGLTIVGDKIEPLGNNEYTILNPQIVNGCQTIHCLYHVYDKNGELSDKLKVFVKLVNTNKIEVQTDIISATNSQNPVKSASLKANDNIQRNIEKHLKKSSIYYERRENYYKRQGFSGNKVIGLLKMAQIIHTVVNKSAIEAANDTSTLFETEKKYNSIFNILADYDIYSYATILFQKIWTLKNSDIRRNDYPDEKRSLISKGGFILLNTMNSLLMSRAKFKKGNYYVSENHNKKIDISLPSRKNDFTKRKEWILKKVADEIYLEGVYDEAKNILLNAAVAYEEQTGKQQVALFKNRKFDYEYLRIEIDKVLNAT